MACARAAQLQGHLIVLLNRCLARSGGRAAPRATSRRTRTARITRKRSRARRTVKRIPVACAVAEIVTGMRVRLSDRSARNGAAGYGRLVIAAWYAHARQETRRNRH